MADVPEVRAEALSRALADAPDVVGVPVATVDDAPVLLPGVPASVVGSALDPERCHRRGFAGKVGEALAIEGEPLVVLVGCGPRPDLDALRRAGAELVRAVRRADRAVVVLPAGAAAGAEVDRAAQAVVEGVALGGYRFTTYKSAPTAGETGARGVARLVIGVAGDENEGAGDERAAGAVVAADHGARRGARISAAVYLARDLVNEPPSTMTPRRFAQVAADVAASGAGMTLEVWDEERIARERLGGLLAVARGSAEPPRLVRATYEPSEPATGHVVLVGKGITFDSGGLSLKSASGMTTMKTDMSGAAAVLAAIGACGDLGVRARVTAIAPLTENMPGGRAQKPGDVLTTRDGTTIEVLNTDAEGRLVLADALALAKELGPDAIVDLATLTGACVVALGNRIAGLFTNDEPLGERVQAASRAAGEPTWLLPLPEEYRTHIDSDVADVKNVGKEGQAGAIAAAMLLARFVGEVPWAHLDIAGPARSDEDSGILTKGGTGFGVRTLLELVRDFSA